MPAPLGNRFWEARTTHGRHKIFETPEILWESCVEYFEWCEANPLLEQKIFHTNGVITKDTVSKMRAMTLDGLCLFLGVNRSTWDEYRKRQDFCLVIEHAEKAIREQKFTGAAADLLNANIIARDLGLRDGVEHTGKDGGAIQTEHTLDRNYARRLAFMLSEAAEESDK